MKTRYWEERWDKTCGYLVFKTTFNAGDVCNARFRYQRISNDQHFPVTFNKKDYSIINNKVRDKLDKQKFWAAVVAPTQAFFDNDWSEWWPRGEAFMETKLCALYVDNTMINKLPEEKRDKAKREVAQQLLDANVISIRKERPVNYTPEPIKIERKYSEELPPTSDDVLESLKDVL